MSNEILISEAEIRERAEANARIQARNQLVQEKRAAAAREYVEHEARRQQMQAARDNAHTLMATLQPRYARRMELLNQIAPALDELMRLDPSLKKDAQTICEPIVGHWLGLGQDPKKEIPTLRAAAGLPEWHDSVSRTDNSTGQRLAQALGQLIASGAIDIAHNSMAAENGAIILTIHGTTAAFK